MLFCINLPLKVTECFEGFPASDFAHDGGLGMLKYSTHPEVKMSD